MDGTQNTLRKEKLVVGEVTNDDIIIPIVFRMSTQVVEVRGDVVCCLGFATNCGNSTRHLEWCN